MDIKSYTYSSGYLPYCGKSRPPEKRKKAERRRYGAENCEKTVEKDAGWISTGIFLVLNY